MLCECNFSYSFGRILLKLYRYSIHCLKVFMCFLRKLKLCSFHFVHIFNFHFLNLHFLSSNTIKVIGNMYLVSFAKRLKRYRFFFYHSLKICIYFFHNSQIICFTFFPRCELGLNSVYVKWAYCVRNFSYMFNRSF